MSRVKENLRNECIKTILNADDGIPEEFLQTLSLDELQTLVADYEEILL
jgi:hypothetical protein